MPSTNFAIVTDVRLADDGVFLILATCQRCNRTVCHGGGTKPLAIVLGDRRAHCKCEGSYELVDVADVIPRRLQTIVAELREKADRRSQARARRAAAEEA